VLIHEDAQHGTATAEEFHRLRESLTAIKKGVPQFLTPLTHVGIEVGIVQRSVDAGGLFAHCKEAGHLGEELPTAEMKNAEEQRVIRGGLVRDVLQPFDCDPRRDLALLHERELEAAENVSPKGGKVVTRRLADLFLGPFFSESDAQIVNGESAMTSVEEVGHAAEKPTDPCG
jgi:hypothetical protein